jgi:hypothetical protein
MHNKSISTSLLIIPVPDIYIDISPNTHIKSRGPWVCTKKWTAEVVSMIVGEMQLPIV